SVSVFYTGLATRELFAVVSAGGTTTLDITLERFDCTRADDPLRLDSFVVATNREYNAQSIAINEQRFAAGIKNVVSSDEFGAIGEANIGEFIKFILGVDISHNGGI